MAAPGCAIPIYRDASWKGVSFLCETSNDEFGRRGDQYEYPLSEETGYKDLGRKIRRFKLEGYLIGSDQVDQSVQMARAAESPQPGMLIHPMFGSQMVACVTLRVSADYRRDIKRTKLDFDFVEANSSMAPYSLGASVAQVFASGSAAVNTARDTAPWAPTVPAIEAASRVGLSLASYVLPASDEESFDAVAVLQRTATPVPFISQIPQPPAAGTRAMQTASATFEQIRSRAGYLRFDEVVNPIDQGTATIRRLHKDAMQRLRKFNAFVVEQSDGSTPSIESLIVASRLSLIRDYALTAAQTTYATVSEAFLDLDFVMAIYDDEERMAASTCYDVLATAVRRARADAARHIISQNIRLPGVVSFPVDGQWPSPVVAHKLYADGRRYAQIEAYNTQMSPFHMGRIVIAPAS
jgi:prophage DNA circulation protein